MTNHIANEEFGRLKALINNIGSDFGINLYRNKMVHRVLPKFMAKNRKPLRNFQWVQTNDFQIARCAQPNYSLSIAKDEPHEITHEQLKFILRHGIRTIISLNKEQLEPRSRAYLSVNHIDYHHFPKEDFTALNSYDHKTIGAILQNRKNAGAILFYCGYGQGRTGTAIAGWACKYLVCKQQDYFSQLHYSQFVTFMRSVFGVETKEQILELISYTKSFATVEVSARHPMPIPLLSVANIANFVNEDDYTDNVSLASQRPAALRSLSQLSASQASFISEPELPVLPDDAVKIQSLDPVGTIRTSAEAHLIKEPRNSLSSLLSYQYNAVHPKSIYFRRFG